MKPTIHLTSDELPEVKNWVPGNTYRVMLTLRQNNMSVGDPYPDPDDKSKKKENEVSATFEVLRAKALGKPKMPGNRQNGKNNAMMKALDKRSK